MMPPPVWKPFLPACALISSALQEAGVNGVLFCNEKDLPYSFEVAAEIPATMAYIIGRVRDEVHVPFGVNILWDPVATIRLAAATGASFVREVFTGTYESDMGLWSPKGSEAFLVRRQLDCQHVAVFNNITPEFARSIAGRSVAERAKVAAFFGAEALLISGQMAGSSAEPAVYPRGERGRPACAGAGKHWRFRRKYRYAARACRRGHCGYQLQGRWLHLESG